MRKLGKISLKLLGPFTHGLLRLLGHMTNPKLRGEIVDVTIIGSSPRTNTSRNKNAGREGINILFVGKYFIYLFVNFLHHIVSCLGTQQPAA